MMNLFSLGRMVAGVAMLAAFGLSAALTPRETVPRSAVVDLESTVPLVFGAWRNLETGLVQMDLTTRDAGQGGRGGDLASLIYDQVVMRTYRRSDGAIVMLALAYGERQRQELKIHRPELCYVAQGFQVTAQKTDTEEFRGSQVNLTRLLARSERRTEPISYWIRIGDSFVRNAWETRTAIFREGLRGRVPDGILVRVSNAQPSGAEQMSSYAIHDEFIRDLLDALDPAGRRMLLGGG